MSKRWRVILPLLAVVSCPALGGAAVIVSPPGLHCVSAPQFIFFPPVKGQDVCFDAVDSAWNTWTGSAWTPTGAGITSHGGQGGPAILLTNDTNVTLTASSNHLIAGWQGLLDCARMPSLLGAVISGGGTCATALSITGVSPGIYGQVTVEATGRVTAATTIADMAHGGTDLATAADDTVPVSNGTIWQAKALPSCSSAASALTYTTASNTFGCNTIAAGGTVTVTGATTANRFMLGNAGVDIIASIAIDALVLGQGVAAPAAYAGTSGTPGQFLTGLNSKGVGTFATPAGAGDVTHTGSFTTNRVPKATGAANLADSLLADDGATATYTGAGGLALTGGIWDVTEIAAPTLSAVSHAKAYADSTTHLLRLSINGGAYADVRTGVVGATVGGTGQTVYAVGDQLQADTTTTLTRTADVAVGSYWRSGGVNAQAVWSVLKLPNAATTGDTLVATGSNSVGVVAAAALGQMPISQGAATAWIWSAAGVLGTSLTTPVVIGGTTTTSTLALRSTSGVGTTGADVIVQTGNNGAVEVARFFNTGDVSIGTASDRQKLSVNGVIETMTGGVKFPDGTTQVSAATGLSGSGATNQVTYWSGATSLAGNAGLVFDPSAIRLGVGLATPGAKLAVASPDTTVSPGFSLRQSNDVSFGYDFDTENNLVGRLDLYGVTSGVRTLLLSVIRGTGHVGVGTLTPEANSRLDVVPATTGAQTAVNVTMNWTGATARGEFLRAVQTDPTKLASAQFLHIFHCDIANNIAAPNESTCYAGFNRTANAGRSWGGDFHATTSVGDPAPTLLVGVQGTVRQDGAAGGTSHAVLASSEGTTKAFSLVEFKGSASFLAHASTGGFSDEGIVLVPADDANPTFRAFGLTNAANNVNRFQVTKNGQLTLTPTTVTDSVVIANSTRPLAFPTEEGTPGAGTVHLVRLGGTTDADIFLSSVDGQPGTGDANQGRQFIIYARNATAALPVSGASATLSGYFWNGAASVQKAIELENKVRTTGTPELWFEEISGGAGHPFMRVSLVSTNVGRIATHDQPGSILQFQGVDNGLTYSTVARIVGAATPYWEFSQMTGAGTVVLCVDASGKLVRGVSAASC